MNIKKILLSLLTIFLIMSSINAVTSLTSCGKNSGWINGETYTLDFNVIPDSYSNTYCFRFNQDRTGVIIQGNGQEIINEDQGLTSFIDVAGSYNVFSLTVKDFNLTDTTGNTQGFYHDKSTSTRGWAGGTTLNVHLKNIERFVWYQTTGRYIDQDLINSSFIEMDVYVYRQNTGNSQKGSGNNIYNSLLHLNDLGVAGTGEPFNHYFYDSVILGNDDPSVLNILSPNSNLYTDSLISGYINTDSNDNNVADSQLDAKFINSVISLNLYGFNFIQNLEEGEELYTNYLDNNLSNIYINNEILLDTHIGSYYTNENSKPNEFSGTLIIEKQNNLIINGGVNCNLLRSDKCVIQDDPNYTAVTTNLYRGLLNVGGSTLENMKISKIGSSNSNLISNLIDVYSSNLILRNNEFSKTDNRIDDDNNEILILKANNLNINNNDFDVFYNNGQSYEILNIKSTTPNKNKITENTFDQNLVSSKVDQIIFKNDADTTFYNNFVGQNFIISDSAKSNLNVNPVTSIIYNNQIYYFSVGNYYQDNTGCNDLDSNGICDNSYTSGAITDNKPLSSYPYVYLSRLSNADSVVSVSPFNITLNIIENQTFTFSDLTVATINLSFTQNSDYADLTCSYYLDGAIISEKINPSKDVNNDLIVGSLTEKSYSYRVECINDYDSKISDEITFNVIEEVETDGGSTGGDTGGSTGTNTGTDFSLNIVGGTTSETSEGFLGFLQLVETPLGYLVVLGLVLFGLSILGFLFALMLSVVR
jgi:hypothetical protein